jgi:predicted amino acid-binding ACT domain protein
LGNQVSTGSIAFYVHGDDRSGAVADILKKLAEARISLGAMQAVCGGAGTYGGVISLSPAAAQKAAAVLGVA